MTIKQLLNDTTVEAVIEELLVLYPECVTDKQNYIQVANFIMETPLISFDDFIISVGLIDPSLEEDYEEDIDEAAYLSISGYSEKEELHFALGFARWEEWSNANLIIQENLEINPVELVAICLYEMTFYGFDQVTIASELKDLESGITNEMYH